MGLGNPWFLYKKLVLQIYGGNDTHGNLYLKHVRKMWRTAKACIDPLLRMPTSLIGPSVQPSVKFVFLLDPFLVLSLFGLKGYVIQLLSSS